MADEHKLTREAYEKLKKEVEDLKGPVRRQVADAIKEAKSHGDLRENAAYHEAKLNETRLNARVADLERTLQLAKIVDTAGVSGAQMGNTLKLKDLDYDDELELHLVSSYEADPAKDRISISSPLGAALVGREEGDEVEVDAPSGKQRYQILGIQ